jgi:hypothetical protein
MSRTCRAGCHPDGGTSGRSILQDWLHTPSVY